MTPGRYLVGVVLTAVLLLALALVARALRSWLRPNWSGAPARLAEIVLGLTFLVITAEALGLIGLFRLIPILAVCVVSGLVGLSLRKRAAKRREPAVPTLVAPPVGRAGIALAIAASAALFAQWGTRLATALDEGITGIDSLGYHMPFAASFVQDATFTNTYQNFSEAHTTFLPATSELLHAIGILLFGSDFLSPLLNLGWLAIGLLAAWCVGRPFGAAPVSLLGVAVLLGAPTLAFSQPGTAKNDIAAVALILAATALLVTERDARRPGTLAGLAGLAGGLSLGMKLTAIVPVGALGAAVLAVSRRGSRAAVAAAFAAALVLAGGYWYARNAAVAASPLPWAEIGIGPLSLPSVDRPFWAPREETVVARATDAGFWSDVAWPGFADSLGPAWPVVLGAALLGMLLSAVRGEPPLVRLLGGVGVVAIIGWAFTPASAGAGGTQFAPSLRYLMPALAIGLSLLPVSRSLRVGRRGVLMISGLTVLLVVTLGASETWTERHAAFAVVLGGTVLTAGALIAVRRSVPAPLWTGALSVIAVFGVAVGRHEHQQYIAGRYGASTSYLSGQLGKTYLWAQNVHDASIGISGLYPQYPLFGRNLSNRVGWVVEERRYGEYARVTTCRDWRRELDEGGYHYVITAPFGTPYVAGPERPAEEAWTSGDRHAKLILRDDMVSVFKLDGPLDPDTCR